MPCPPMGCDVMVNPFKDYYSSSGWRAEGDRTLIDGNNVILWTSRATRRRSHRLDKWIPLHTINKCWSLMELWVSLIGLFRILLDIHIFWCLSISPRKSSVRDLEKRRRCFEKWSFQLFAMKGWWCVSNEIFPPLRVINRGTIKDVISFNDFPKPLLIPGLSAFHWALHLQFIRNQF